MKYAGDITRVHGIRVGQAENEAARTGVTVVLCRKDGAVGGCSVRGAAPGTRETDLLRPGNLVNAKKMEISLPEVKISVDPKFGYLVQTRILDGKKYIVISADSGVEINGVSVSIAQ